MPPRVASIHREYMKPWHIPKKKRPRAYLIKTLILLKVLLINA